LLDFQTVVEGTGFSAEGVGNYIGFSRVIMDTKIIVLDELNPSPLSNVQLRLGKDILETFVISVNITPVSYEIMAPSLESVNYDG
jgi:hypothetical protein